MDDTSRQVAAGSDEYTLTIEDAAARYEHAGHPRTPRSIKSYCAKGPIEKVRYGARLREALRQAMMAMLDGGAFTNAAGNTLVTYAHPLFWAPYSIIGDGGGARN